MALLKYRCRIVDTLRNDETAFRSSVRRTAMRRLASPVRTRWLLLALVVLGLPLLASAVPLRAATKTVDCGPTQQVPNLVDADTELTGKGNHGVCVVTGV